MTRTIIETETPGWFEDPESPGKKVRKKDGDVVVTRAEYEQAILDAEDQKAPTAEQVEERKAAKDESAKRLRDAAKDGKAAKVTLSSGKVVEGQTVVIKCAWVDPDKRTPAQEKLFATADAKRISYEAVVKAAGGKKAAMPSGEERLIKKQDAFQVRFSTTNQRKWRNECKRRKAKARRQERKATA